MSHQPFDITSMSRGQGFSLIEVLVTLVVLSFGLLSLAALQITTLKHNSSALTRFEATTLAYDILDRMRANRSPAIQGSYNIGVSDTATNEEDIAGQDLATWKAALGDRLPAGNGSIVVDGRQATVSVQWSEYWDESLDNQFMTLTFRTEL